MATTSSDIYSNDADEYQIVKQYGQCLMNALREATQNTETEYIVAEIVPAYHKATADIMACKHTAEPDEYVYTIYFPPYFV